MTQTTNQVFIYLCADRWLQAELDPDEPGWVPRPLETLPRPEVEPAITCREVGQA